MMVMNKEQTANRFEQLKGKVKETWAKLTDDDILLYKGKREQFLGKLKEHYGIAQEDAEKQIRAFEDACGCASDDQAA